MNISSFKFIYLFKHLLLYFEKDRSLLTSRDELAVAMFKPLDYNQQFRRVVFLIDIFSEGGYEINTQVEKLKNMTIVKFMECDLNKLF